MQHLLVLVQLVQGQQKMRLVMSEPFKVFCVRQLDYSLSIHEESKKLSFSFLVTLFFSIISAKMEFLQKKYIHFLMLEAFRKDVESKQIASNWCVYV